MLEDFYALLKRRLAEHSDFKPMDMKELKRNRNHKINLIHYQRVKENPERLMKHRESCRKSYRKYFQKILENPEKHDAILERKRERYKETYPLVREERNKKRRELYNELKNDPEFMAKRRKQANDYYKTEKGREKKRQNDKKRRERIKADPILYAAYLERKRKERARYRAKKKAEKATLAKCEHCENFNGVECEKPCDVLKTYLQQFNNKEQIQNVPSNN